MQTTPALLCRQERVKEHGHPQTDPLLEDKAVSEDADTHQKAFLPGMLAALHIPQIHTSAVSHCLPTFTKTKKLLQVHKVRTKGVAHPRYSTSILYIILATQQDYFAGDDCEFHNRWTSRLFQVHLWQVALIKLLQKRKWLEKKRSVGNNNLLSFPFFLVHARKRPLDCSEKKKKMLQAMLSHHFNFLIYGWLRWKRQKQKAERHFRFSPAIYSRHFLLFSFFFFYATLKTETAKQTVLKSEVCCNLAWWFGYKFINFINTLLLFLQIWSRKKELMMYQQLKEKPELYFCSPVPVIYAVLFSLYSSLSLCFLYFYSPIIHFLPLFPTCFPSPVLFSQSVPSGDPKLCFDCSGTRSKIFLRATAQRTHTNIHLSVIPIFSVWDDNYAASFLVALLALKFQVDHKQE